MAFSMDRILKQARSKWMEADGPAADIVLSSRVRLARNLADLDFPHLLEGSAAAGLLDKAGKTVTQLNGNGSLVQKHGAFALVPLASLSPLDRQVLVEKHLISPQLAARGEETGAILSEDEAISIMINEEDHVRIQCLYPGLGLEGAAATAAQIDDSLEAELAYAFDERWGYLTTCPTNVGTGLRASVMMHLPGLVMTRQIGRVLTTLSKVGISVRGLYGEGTEAIGNIFQVSNQVTLGHGEEEIIRNLAGLSRQIIEQERSARERLLNDMKQELEDRVCRAHGILAHARVMASNEAMKLLSDLRLGIDLNLISHVQPGIFNELLVMTRPGYLQRLAGGVLGPAERDIRRAALIRERLSLAGRH